MYNRQRSPAQSLIKIQLGKTSWQKSLGKSIRAHIKYERLDGFTPRVPPLIAVIRRRPQTWFDRRSRNNFTKISLVVRSNIRNLFCFFTVRGVSRKTGRRLVYTTVAADAARRARNVFEPANENQRVPSESPTAGSGRDYTS